VRVLTPAEPDHRLNEGGSGRVGSSVSARTASTPRPPQFAFRKKKPAPSHQEPMVRIHLPPAQSQANFVRGLSHRQKIGAPGGPGTRTAWRRTGGSKPVLIGACQSSERDPFDRQAQPPGIPKIAMRVMAS
jgi:hypothetical protein